MKNCRVPYIFIVFLFIISCEYNGKEQHTESEVTFNKTDSINNQNKKRTINDSIGYFSNQIDAIDSFRRDIFEKKKSLNKTFVVNDIESCWYFDPDKRFEITLFGLYEVFGPKRIRRMMVMNRDNSFENFEEKWFNNEIDAEFTNVNFDRFDDFVIYSQEKSGNGGRFYDVYTFFIKETTFNYSEELSGANLIIDPETKTTSKFWKSGVRWNITEKFTFRGDGEIHYTEVTENQVKSVESQDYLITTYKKYKYEELLKTKIDTTVFEGW